MHRTGHASQASVVYPATGSQPRHGDEQPAYCAGGVWAHSSETFLLNCSFITPVY